MQQSHRTDSQTHNFGLGEAALYPKAPTEVRDPYRILNWVVVAGALTFKENYPLLQLKVSTSDKNATRPASQRWGCHLRMYGGCVHSIP